MWAILGIPFCKQESWRQALLWGSLLKKNINKKEEKYMRTCSLSFPNPQILLRLWWKQMKSIIILPINGEYNCKCGAVKHSALKYSNKTRQSAPGRPLSLSLFCDTQTWGKIWIYVADILVAAALVFLRTESSRKDEEGGSLTPPHGWAMGAPWHNHANAIILVPWPEGPH